MTAVKFAGLNAIHLYAGEVHDDGDPSTDWRNTDSIVEWARQESLYVVMLCAGGAKQGAEKMTELARISWSFYAPRYADQTHVVYELFNEPCLATYHCDEAVMQGIREIYALVRSEAPESHIMLMSHSNLKGGMKSLWEDIERLGDDVDWSNASYAFHGYGTTAEFQEQACREMGAAGYAMSCTEFPFNQAQSLASAYERAGISYFWFEACWGGGRSPGTMKSYLSRLNLTWQPDFGDWPEPHVEQIPLWADAPPRRASTPDAHVVALNRVVLGGAIGNGEQAVYDIRGRLLASPSGADGPSARRDRGHIARGLFLMCR
jgi:hypothetical protein